MQKITIIGTGLIGTSLGLALKGASLKDVEIVGLDLHRSNASKAQSMGAVDHTTGNLNDAVRDARMVIIATPITEIRHLMEEIGSRLPEGCLVTDTAGSKGVVLEWAETYLGRRVSFVGGHPMVSADESGPEAADASLFKGRPYCIVPAKGADQDAVKMMTEMISAIGAKAYFIDVTEHDSFVCAVSKLPFLLSVALVGCTSKSPSWDDIAKVASAQFRDVTSPASTDPVIQREVFLSDNQPIVHWIDAFINELYQIRQVLTGDEAGKRDALGKLFTQAYEARNRWMVGAVDRSAQISAISEHVPSAGETMASLFTGSPEFRKRMFGWGGRGDKDQEKKK